MHHSLTQGRLPKKAWLCYPKMEDVLREAKWVKQDWMETWLFQAKAMGPSVNSEEFPFLYPSSGTGDNARP